MTLVLREADVRAVLTMSDTMRVLDAAFRRQAAGEARNQPRRRVVLPEGRGVLHVLPAYVPGTPGHPEADGPGLVGLKDYSAIAGKVRFLIQLFSAEDGRLLALIEADLLGQMRTGGASGVATRYMARPDARVVGLIGAGGQAQTQALAMREARPVEKFLVYGRSIERARAFCEALAAETGVACRRLRRRNRRCARPISSSPRRRRMIPWCWARGCNRASISTSWDRTGRIAAR